MNYTGGRKGPSAWNKGLHLYIIKFDDCTISVYSISIVCFCSRHSNSCAAEAPYREGKLAAEREALSYPVGSPRYAFDLLMFRCDEDAMKVFGRVCCFGVFFPFQEKIGTDCDVLEPSSVGPSRSPDGM